MLTIKCPKCGNKIDEGSIICSHCGVPCVVSITISAYSVQESTGPFAKNVAVIDSDANILWEGTYEENIAFAIDKPTQIIVLLGGYNIAEYEVEPGKKYHIIPNYKA